MEIRCNISSCRKPLTNALWVTSCSHSFCEDHASTLTLKNVKCPACSTILGKRFDVIRQTSNPAKEFRSMLLVGLRPEIILDIASCGISFWNYQMEIELKFQSAKEKHFRESVGKLTGNQQALVTKLTTAQKTCEGHKTQMLTLQNAMKHLKDQIISKDRQLQKLQKLINSMNCETHSWAAERKNDFEDDHCHTENKPFLEHNTQDGSGNNNASNSSGFVFEPQFISKEKPKRL